MSHRYLGVLVVAVTSAAAVAHAVVPAYDVTGHWTGAILAASQGFTIEGDLAAVTTRRFEGDVDVNGVPCTVRGKRKKKVKLRLVCLDGTKAKLKGLLDIANDTIVGTGRLRKSGRRAAAEFAIAKVVATSPVCGNGTVEAGEQCDDGNTVPGDGCDALCQSENPPPLELDEVEPNDSPAQATVVASLPAIAHGSVDPGGDEDFYRIELTGSDLVLETSNEAGLGSCDADTDTIIELRGPGGVSVVAVDDDGGPGLCSRVELHGLTPGVYYPCVRSFAIAVGVPAYQLHMTVS
jgi:cysteine-rich repeat protein